MIDVATVSNQELDERALASDGQQGEAMLRGVYNFLGRFVAFPSEHARVAHALWIVHCHLMDAWESTPRIAFLSAEPGSGKTRALEITELVVPAPVCAVNVSAAYLFRKVGSDPTAPPTILFDEIDTVFGPKAKEHEELRALINAGHRRGAVAGRCVVRGKTVETEEIPAYSAVALAGLGWLPDTILSRSIIIRMRRRLPNERVEAFRRRIHGRQGDLVRAQIETWARSQSRQITWPEMPAEIQDRDADVWEPLLAVADLVGGDWPQRARKAAVALVAAAKDAEPSLGIRLLSDLKTVFGDADQLSTKTILRGLIDIEESPWGDLRGKPLDERGLASRLRQYGIRSANVRIGSETPKGYKRADLFDAWTRYIPSIPVRSATSATSATTSDNRGFSVADVAEPIAHPSHDKAPQISLVANVADVADFAGMGDATAGARECAQCGAGDDGNLHLYFPRPDRGKHWAEQTREILRRDIRPVWLHPECHRFFENGNWKCELIQGGRDD